MIIEKWDTDGLINVYKNGLLPQALRASGMVVETQAKMICPTNSGFTKGSIYHKLTDDGMAVQIGAPGEVAFWLEMGTGKYAENGKGRTPGWYFVTDAKITVNGTIWEPLSTTKDGKFLYYTEGMIHPFLRPALYHSKENILKIFNSQNSKA